MTIPSALAPGRPGERLGIIAGGGILPRIVAAEAEKVGWVPFFIPIADGVHADWTGVDHQPLSWAKTGDVFGVLAARGVRTVVFCGTISVRPDYRSLIPSLRTLSMLPEILRMVRGGDDSLLRGVAKAFEHRGLRVVGVQAVAPGILMPLGTLSRRRPDPRETAAIDRASRAATQLGLLDIGQAVVASPDRVVAMEGIEGTREMLKRVADLRDRGRIGRGEPCVLFKSFKPQQDTRFDLPSIGVETVEEAEAAGLSGIALTAERSLMIGADEVVRQADRAGLFLIGVADGSPSPEATV